MKGKYRLFILILLIVFSAGSINILLLALGFVSFVPHLLPGQVIVPYAFVSFAVMICISVYHIYTMLRNNRRKQDKQSAAAVSRHILSKNN